MTSELLDLMKPMTWLTGTWEGKGMAQFPTHADYAYENRMRFDILEEAFQQEPIIHIEEIAWGINRDEREFKHWETGYFKPESNGSIQLYVCHNTGRMEICYGTYTSLDEKNKSFSIEIHSESIRNDTGTAELVRSKRTFTLHQNRLFYTLTMSTKKVSMMTHHLKTVLHKIDA